MDSSYGWRTGRPCSHHHHHPHHHHQRQFFLCPRHPHHHHHHHHRILPHCPLHCSLLQSNSHSQICTRCNPLLPSPQIPEPVPFVSSQNNFNSDYNQQAYTSNALVMQEGNEGLEAEDDEDFVFVLTDEWKEFFAKSEAKRRLAKKQAKKKCKD